jgi:flagellar biogenesis protein FliO
MMRSFGFAALALSLIAGGKSLGAESDTSSGPPAWQDGTSMYLTMNDTASISPQPRPAAPSDNRRLAPRSSAALSRSVPDGANQNRAAGEGQQLPDFGPPLKSIYTVISALAIVIGAFLLLACLVRRGGRNMGQSLPTEVVGVLGRVPLTARQFAQLLRVGNKLVLVSVTPNGAETITEVTDPLEVDRIVGLCQQSHPHSTSKAFEQVFRQLSREPASSGLLARGPTAPAAVPSLDMFRAQLGEATRAK